MTGREGKVEESRRKGGKEKESEVRKNVAEVVREGCI